MSSPQRRGLEHIAHDILNLHPLIPSVARAHLVELSCFDSPAQVRGTDTGREVAIRALKGMKDVKSPALEKLKAELKKRIGL